MKKEKILKHNPQRFLDDIKVAVGFGVTAPQSNIIFRVTMKEVLVQAEYGRVKYNMLPLCKSLNEPLMIIY